MALSRSMATSMTSLAQKRTVILSVILLAVVASGVSQIELHTHSDPRFGQVHGVHDHLGTDAANSGDVGDPGNNGVVHTHDIGATALALLPEFDVNVVAHQKADGSTPPPSAHPPDNLITPLQRPPIV